MIYVSTTLFLVLLGWSMLSFPIGLALGAWIRHTRPEGWDDEEWER